MTVDTLSSSEETKSSDDFKVENFDNSELKEEHFIADTDKMKKFVFFPLVLYVLQNHELTDQQTKEIKEDILKIK